MPLSAGFTGRGCRFIARRDVRAYERRAIIARRFAIGDSYERVRRRHALPEGRARLLKRRRLASPQLRYDEAAS